MNSISDMFFDGWTRILTNIHPVDLVERASHSVIWEVVLIRVLQLLHLLQLPNVPGCATLDPLLPMLFGWMALVVDKEPVYLRPNSRELVDRLAVRLVIEFANHIVDGRVEQ